MSLELGVILWLDGMAMLSILAFVLGVVFSLLGTRESWRAAAAAPQLRQAGGPLFRLWRPILWALFSFLLLLVLAFLYQPDWMRWAFLCAPLATFLWGIAARRAAMMPAGSLLETVIPVRPVWVEGAVPSEAQLTKLEEHKERSWPVLDRSIVAS